jgi:hypothetical protein
LRLEVAPHPLGGRVDFDEVIAAGAGWVPPSPLYLIRCARAKTQARKAAQRVPALAAAVPIG